MDARRAAVLCAIVVLAGLAGALVYRAAGDDAVEAEAERRVDLDGAGRRALEILAALRDGDDLVLAGWVDFARFHEGRRLAGSDEETPMSWAWMNPAGHRQQRVAILSDLLADERIRAARPPTDVGRVEVTAETERRARVSAPLADGRGAAALRCELVLTCADGPWRLVSLTYHQAPEDGR